MLEETLRAAIHCLEMLVIPALRLSSFLIALGQVCDVLAVMRSCLNGCCVGTSPSSVLRGDKFMSVSPGDITYGTREYASGQVHHPRIFKWEIKLILSLYPAVSPDSNFAHRVRE